MIKTPLPHRFAFVAIISSGFIILSFIALVVFHNFPFSLDEYIYLYQAKIFLSGHLFIPASQKISDLFETHLLFSHGRLLSKYPPGFPALLLLGLKLGIPGLINPLLSIGSLILFCLMGTQLAGSLFALSVLLLLVTNSYFLAYGASYYAQPSVLFLSALTLFFYIKYRTDKKILWLCAAALVISGVTLVRIPDAFCLWLALFIDFALSKTKNKYKSLILFCLLSSVGTLLLLVFNYALTSSWCIAPYNVLKNDLNLFHTNDERASFYALFLNFKSIYLSHLKNNLCPLLTEYFLPYFLCWIPLLILNFRGLKKGNLTIKNYGKLFLIYTLIFIALYNASSGLGWPQYGARFWYPLIVPITLLTVQGAAVFYSIVPRRIFWSVFGLFILWQVFQSLNDFNLYESRFTFVQKIQTDINTHCPGKAIVVLHNPNHGLGKFISWKDFKRNPSFNGLKLYVKEGYTAESIRKAYPDYPVCNYYFKNIGWDTPPSIYQRITKAL